MLLFSPNPLGSNPLPCFKSPSRYNALPPFRTRLAEALCREPRKMQPCLGHEQGSAVVEFTFLALLLMVPLVYFVITVGQIQGGSFAVVGAADQAAKVYVAQADASTAEAAAEQAVALGLSDFGLQADRARMSTICNPADCQAAGSTVTVTVSLNVPLPFIPFAEGLSATEVEASSTQLVGRYR
ncbi:hypothetical protein GCM10007170_15080 [Arthrobacter liuii]|uniref:Flp pilus assembly protein TadG n=1 Tax=Arthrobacter liuii TaxID=1476996 RepID=A0ABQ2AM67_9MICC|nr:hypothetical protein GCM10007170_15080 [Arthrobacter liuii]